LVLTCKLTTYSNEIAKHLFSNERQKLLNHPTESQPPEFFNQFAAEDDIFELLEVTEIKLAVHRCLKRLSVTCQRILRGYMEGVSATDSAKDLGYTTLKIYQVRKSECMNKFEVEVRRCRELKGLSF
jgi:DNA-directed RNA polymerase specialized sigma24 family protein